MPFVCLILVITAGLSLPAITAVFVQLKNKRPRNCFYEDVDGYGTPETITRFSNGGVKTAILLFAILGNGISVVILLVLILPNGAVDQILELGLFTGAWGLVLIQAICIAAHHSSRKSHDLGIWLLASTLLLGSFSAWHSIQVAPQSNSLRDPVVVFWVFNTLTSLCLGVSSTLLPKRPDVFFNGCKIDRQRTVSLLSRYTWSWIQPLLLHASTMNDLDMDVIPSADRTLRSRELKKDWDALKIQTSLLRSLWWAYKGRLATLWTVTIVRCLVGIVPFWTMLRILNRLEIRRDSGCHNFELMALVIGMALSNLLDAWMEGWAFWYSVSDLSLPIRAQLSSLVFYKSLRRKNNKTDDKTEYDGDVRTNSDKCGSRESTETSTKETMVLQSRQAVVNLVGVDTDRISYFFQLQFLIVNGVFKLLISSAFLVWLIGWIPFSAGVLAWTLIFPISAWSSSLLLTQSASLMELRDAKLSKINEALRGIRQIKFSALESQWERRILALRSMELRALWRYFVADSALFGCGVMGPILLAVTSLVTYVLINNQLLPSVAFVSIALLSTLESTLGTLPELITLGIDTLVSINRLDTYLKGSEMENTLTRGPTVGFKEATISWHVDFNATEEGTFTLDNLNLAFPTGQLSVISGKTGSGKSLLVSAILGEANLLKGSILMPETSHPSGLGTAHSQDWIVRGRLAYVSQNPWLENNSLRDNILFGLPFIRERYDKVINMCALRQDLELLTDSDSTELGADGVNLSGGQKWRITLARAIYSRAEILILEDIFCAVDALVGRWILDKCLVGELCESRTRILVTHNLGLVLPKAKYVVELEEGTVRYSGSPQHDIRLPDPQQGPAWKDITDATQSRSTLEDGLVMSYAENTKASRSSPMTSQPKPARKFVQDETHKKGNVLKRVYITYLKSSGGLLLWGLCAIVFVTYQVGILGRGWWLRLWTTQEEFNIPKQGMGFYSSFSSLYSVQQHIPRHSSIQPFAENDLIFYLNVYVIISLVTATIGVMRFFGIYFLAIRASGTIFDKLVFTIMHQPLRWIDAVPIGRIINRFTADFVIIDQRLPLSWIMFFTNLVRLIGICIASFLTSALLSPPAIILLLIGFLIGKRYIAVSRPLKRLESKSKSPIFELFNTTLTGLSTIRAFQKIDVYLTQLHNSLDNWTMMTFYTALANRWMSFRMALLAASFCVAVGIVIILNPSIDAALAGFALSFVLDFSDSIRWAIRCYGDMELDMNSMERVDEYMTLETETLSGSEPPLAWPASGTIEVKNLEVAYDANLPPVLTEVSFRVQHGERVGVVGRTGAGKSSLALALFRFLETRSGSIIIDGIDISVITLHDLRSRLAIVPQDPVLFSGTLRSNLDPFDDHTDIEIFEALSRVQLINIQPDRNGGDDITQNKSKNNIFSDLSSPISEFGGNLSQGQRQLLCIARTIIARPKIVVFDEATSAVDTATDALMQRSIRSGFTDSTLIVIAHRLSTIADFDKIVVLDKGHMVEFGTPRELWEKNGTFRSMCESGSENGKKKTAF